MQYTPRYSSQVARFIDLLSFILTYPWITIASLTAANYLILKPDQRSRKTKCLHYFIYGPLLAILCLLLVPFAILGYSLWILICVVFHSSPYSLVSFTKQEKSQQHSDFSFGTMNVVMGQEVLGKFNNCSWVYDRLKNIAAKIIKQDESFLSNMVDGLSKNETVLSSFPKMDFICFQEVTDRFFALALISMLRKHYSHFIFDIGVNSLKTNLFLANSGLMIASKYPVLKVQFKPFTKKKGWQKGVSYGVVICKLDLGHNNVGILANLHTMAYQGLDPLIDLALTELRELMDSFRKEEVDSSENILFDVIGGDFNCDNISPGDLQAAGNDLFEVYTDTPMDCPGIDKVWAVGTEMRQMKLNTPEMQDTEIFRDILVDDVRRRHYILDADVVEQTFDLMVCDPKPDKEGEVTGQSWGGMRRIDKILVRAGSAAVTGMGYVSALAGLTDHVPVVLSLSCVQNS